MHRTGSGIGVTHSPQEDAVTALPADGPASDGGMPRNVESPTRNRPHRGRRPGNPDTRSHIAQVASRLFLRDGFHRTSLRAVAREAEVDPALVHHYFSSKENLFFASMEIGIDPDKVFKHATEPGTSALGRRLASLIVRIWESSTGEGILNSFLDAPGTIQLYGSVVERQMERAFDLFFPGRTAAKLEALAQVQAIVSGMVLTRYALRLKAATSLSSAQAIRMYGDLIQSVIDRTVEDLEA